MLSSPLLKLRDALKSEFARFLAVGGAAAAINVGARILFGNFMPFNLAVVAAFFVGLTTAFLLTRSFVFIRAANGARASIGNQFWRFLLVNIAALPQTFVISVAILHFSRPYGLPYAETVAHTIGVCVPVLTSFIGHRHFTFRTPTK